MKCPNAAPIGLFEGDIVLGVNVGKSNLFLY